MSCTGSTSCTCGCCGGTSVQTPQPRDNSPGLAALSYRVGTWASFNESMLARLSSSDYPALAPLKTRDNDDFSIALLDASAIVLDILSFYQERLANEGYLRTAQQTRSMTELSRLIGYQPSPGVSASTYAAFTIKAAPGQAPDPTTLAYTIPQGTQVQSVPAQGQTAQTFETAADIQAKADWSALPVQTSAPWVAPGTSNGVYLTGTTNQLQQGDALLLLGVTRETWSSSGSTSAPSREWQVVVINQVQLDPVRNLTYVTWNSPFTAVQATSEPVRVVDEIYSFAALNRFGQNTFEARPLIGMRIERGIGAAPSPWLSTWNSTSAKVFAFRQRATLFGYNAPNPNMFVNPTPVSAGPPATYQTSLPNSITGWAWNSYNIVSSSQIDLDSLYPKAVVGSWFALTASGSIALYQVTGAQTVARADFALSGKVTRLAADYQDPLINPGPPVDPWNNDPFTLRQTEVLLQSDQLTVAEQPLTYPLYGTWLDLQDLRPDVVGLQVVALFGKRQKIAVATGQAGLQFLPDDGTAAVSLSPGDVLTLNDPTPLPLNTDGTIPDWSATPAANQNASAVPAAVPFGLLVEDANGRTGVVQGALNQFVLVASGATDPNVSEYALVSYVGGTPSPYPHTQIQLQSSLANCYERASTTVNVNVALVTHGQSVSEIMGSGNSSLADQEFTLRQTPLTYVQAPTPSGRQSSLQVQVNGVTWTEVDSLYGVSSYQQSFDVLNQPDNTADVIFGDGVEGALLPTGQNNVRANYRIGLGSAGNVGANTLTTLIDRPLGVSAVTNPEAATGGQDPQTLADIRSQAPLSVLTLGRAVSLSDYENYAAAFAGIAKAHALWMPSGPSRGVFLTVAGVDGVALPPGNPTLANLLTSLKSYGNPLIPVSVQSFVETLFGFSANIKYDPAYDQPSVTAQVLQTVSAAFGFEQQGFGQSVSIDQIAAVIQNVPGVVAVNVFALTTVASSVGGDLTSRATGFSLSHWTRWITQRVFVPRRFVAPTVLNAYLPVVNGQFPPLPAEILVLNPDPSSVVLGVMS